MYEGLTTIIYLTNNGIDFGDDLTEKLVELSASYPTHIEQEDFFTYLEEASNPALNPNQSNRDIAIVNELGVEYDIEYARYNGTYGLVPAMEITPKNITRLMKRMENTSVLKNLFVSKINT
jgi:hypothetical protein